MSLFGQLYHALFRGPLAILQLRGRAFGLFVVYLLACAALLALAGHLILTHRQDLIAAVSAYLFPESWRFAMEQLFERFLRSQVRGVLVNATVGGSLLLVSALLFPLKERVSAAFEARARLTTDPVREFPLWFQALEEINLAALFVTAQMSIFWIGYPPDPLRKKVALVLSYVVLFGSYGINFLSPLLQRHRLKYSTILKALFAHPLALFGFGAAFTLPSIFVAKLAAKHPEWSLQHTLVVILASNVACIAWACVAGTWVASRLLPAAQTTRPPSWATRGFSWLMILALFSANVYAFGVVGLSLHHKSQILKCRYQIVPSSLQINFDLAALAVALRMDLEIENPTSFDVEIEKNRLDARHAGMPFAMAQLSPLRVPAGTRVTQHVELPIRLNTHALSKGRELLDWKKWAVTLYVEVTPRFELPVYLLVPVPAPVPAR
jgi:hypothetical protein